MATFPKCNPTSIPPERSCLEPPPKLTHPTREATAKCPAVPRSSRFTQPPDTATVWPLTPTKPGCTTGYVPATRQASCTFSPTSLPAPRLTWALEPDCSQPP